MKGKRHCHSFLPLFHRFSQSELFVNHFLYKYKCRYLLGLFYCPFVFWQSACGEYKFTNWLYSHIFPLKLTCLWVSLTPIKAFIRINLALNDLQSPFQTFPCATMEVDQQEVDIFGAAKSLSHRCSYQHVSKRLEKINHIDLII